MHLAIDSMGNRSEGAGQVLLGVLQALEADPRITRITLFCSPDDSRSFPLPPSAKRNDIPSAALDKRRELRVPWYLWGLGQRCRQLQADALLCLNAMGVASSPTFHLAQQILPFCRQALSQNSARDRFRYNTIKALTRFSLRRSRGITVQTEATKDVIAKLVAGRGIPIEVVTPYRKPAEAPRRPGTLPDDTKLAQSFLFVGSAGRHKTIDGMLSAFTLLANTSPASLLLTLPASVVPPTSNVTPLGRLDWAELSWLYQRVAGLVMPSLVESLGFPLVEALAHGLPIIAADRPYARGLCQDAAIYFEPLEPRTLCAAVDAALSDTAKTRQLGQAAARRGNEIAAQYDYGRLVNQIIDRVDL